MASVPQSSDLISSQAKSKYHNPWLQKRWRMYILPEYTVGIKQKYSQKRYEEKRQWRKMWTQKILCCPMAVIQQKAAYMLSKMTSKRIAFWKDKYKYQYRLMRNMELDETRMRRISSNMHGISLIEMLLFYRYIFKTSVTSLQMT